LYLNDIKILSDEQYSIHLPDYISPNHIIDPFNEDSKEYKETTAETETESSVSNNNKSKKNKKGGKKIKKQKTKRRRSKRISEQKKRSR